MKAYYVYGGMKFGQNTKLHIADEYGKPLCGVKSSWMEAGERIKEDGFIVGEEHLIPITDVFMMHTCSKCLNKWKQRS